MTSISRRHLCIASASAAGTALGLPAIVRAVEPVWPSAHTVRMIVSNPPGQAVDTVGRLFAEYFSKNLGQQFYVDNKAGAGGLIGTAEGARASPDGYTLSITSSGPLVVTPAIKSNVPYDPLKDFAHISNIALTPQTMIVGDSSPFRSVKDVIDAAKAKPGQLNYATSGIGSTSHLGMESFCTTAGIKMTHIPYKGNAEALTQLIAGDVALGSDTVPGALSMVKAGKLRALGVAAPQRSPYLPDVPTLIEQGYNVEALGWIGISSSAGTPKPIIDKLNKAVHAALGTPEFKAKFQTLAFVSIADTPQQFESFIRAERDKWAAVAKAANVHVE